MRGNRDYFGYVYGGFRSIPACAGEPGYSLSYLMSSAVYPRVCGGTWNVPSLLERPWVYPRVCGGTSICHSHRTIPTGLSPRVRGNHKGLEER